MQTATPHPDLHQECLAKLNRALDLVLKTAEAASAEKNHKVVIQASREVTRIATLIIKMTDPKAKPKTQITFISPVSPIGQKSAAPSASKSLNSLKGLEVLFPPPELPIDGISQNLCHNISKNFQEPQVPEAEMARIQANSARHKDKATRQK